MARSEDNSWREDERELGPVVELHPADRKRERGRELVTSPRSTIRLDTLGLRLVRGRGIEPRDIAGAPWVAVINQTFADRHFAGENPLGQTIHVSIGWGAQAGTFDEPQARQIVGVVADVGYPGSARSRSCSRWSASMVSSPGSSA